MTHQVGVSEEAGEAKMERKVSFDQQPSERPPLDRKDSYSGVTRVSFDKPADLYVTSVQSQPEAVQEVPEAAAKVEAAPAKEAGSGNTGTAKRKKKKKSGDEVWNYCMHLFSYQMWIFYYSIFGPFSEKLAKYKNSL